MAEAHLDHPGEMKWFKGEGPAPVIGPCSHTDCRHLGQGVIAWGPTLDRYELVECGIADNAHGCGARCRAWVDGRGRVTTAWLQVEPMPRDACRNCRRPIVMFPDAGWIHDELPQYAHEPITCENAQPVPQRT